MLSSRFILLMRRLEPSVTFVRSFTLRMKSIGYSSRLFVKESNAARRPFTSSTRAPWKTIAAACERQESIPKRRDRRGQLVVKRWQDAYLREGHFNQDRMLSLIEEVLSGGPGEGYPLTRLVAHMDWALEDFPGVNDLVEYETRLIFILPKYKDPVI